MVGGWKQASSMGSERMDWIEKFLKGLMRAVVSRNAECPTRASGQEGSRGQMPEGKIVCYGCEGMGHMRRDCPRFLGEGGAPPQQRQRQVHFAGERGEGKQLNGLVGTENVDPDVFALPILKIDFQRMVVLDVLCWEEKVAAIIDTGAIVSVCLPK